MVMKKILIAENEIPLRETLANHLDQDDYTIFEASNGSECLEIVEKEDIDLILLDIAMPVMDGIETMAELKKRKKTPAVIVLSNREDLETLSEMMSAHVFKYMIKADHSLDEIVAVVKEVLA